MKWQIGQTARFGKTIGESDIYLFAGITGDLNPVHVNEPMAQEMFFKGRIAHGMLGASLICTVLGMHLPGPGTVHLRQNLVFKQPIRIGNTITAHVEILEVLGSKERRRLRLHTWVELEDGTLAIDGEAIVIPPSK